MRKIVVLSFITLDGVVQAPGSPKEDTSGDFKFGGWTVPYFDEFSGNEMGQQMEGEYDLLLRRKTYQIFANYWPEHAADWPGINNKTKYVVSTTLTSTDWANSQIIKGDKEKETLKLARFEL